MRRALGIAITAAIIAAPFALVSSGTSASVPAAVTPANATIASAGPQHWCGSNGITCTEPALDWDEYAGYPAAVRAGAHISGYIGHDEPATLFYSNQPGAGKRRELPTARCPRTRRPSPRRTAAAAPTASNCTRRSGSA